jgi:hypothetical protein
MGAERKSAQFYVRLFALKIAPGLLALVKVLPYHSANKVTSSRVFRMYNLGRGLEVDRVSFWRWLLILTEDAEEEPLWRQWKREETLQADFYLGREPYKRINVVMLVILSVLNELSRFNRGQMLFGILFEIDNFSGSGSHYDRKMDWNIISLSFQYRLKWRLPTFLSV